MLNGTVTGINCDLCPNVGGIFKQTDTGRWVHVVCALYVTGVAFADTLHLTGITLSELPADRWGAKPCAMCEDERFARTGVVISCDAGLCRTYFHVTCAQRDGLLQEVQDMSQEAEAVDPFIAHCKLHASDKHLVKCKKRNFLSLQSRMRFRRALHTSLSSRSSKRLELARQRWTIARSVSAVARSGAQSQQQQQQPHVGPKVPRSLTTSPAAVRILMRKADLMGFSSHSLLTHGDVTDVRRKWHVAPAFSLEFVSYFIDRGARIRDLQQKLQQLRQQESLLKREEQAVMKIMNEVMPQYEAVKSNCMQVREQARNLWTKLAAMAGDGGAGPSQASSSSSSTSTVTSSSAAAAAAAAATAVPTVFKDSPQKESSRRGSMHQPNGRGKGRPAGGSGQHSPLKMSLSQELDWKECGTCRKNVDQHLLTLCDSCKVYFHLYCLDPPLTRMPKKTRFGGWQCSDCSDRQKRLQLLSLPGAVPAAIAGVTGDGLDAGGDGDGQGADAAAGASGRKRTRRGPDKYVPDADKFRAAAAAAAAASAQSSGEPGADGPPKKRRGRPPMTEKQKRMKAAAKLREQQRQQRVKLEISLDQESSSIAAALAMDLDQQVTMMPVTPVMATPVKKQEHECCKCSQSSGAKMLVQ